MKKMQKRNNCAAGRHGFSLIELLIVLAILVLLASLVAPRLLGSREKANVDAAKTQISLLKTSLEMYSLHMGGYPSTEQGLKALVERPSSSSLSETSGDDGFGGDDEFGVEEDLADLGLDDEAESLDGDSGGNSNWQGSYLKSDSLPKDPWGTAYRYEFPGQNNKVGEPDIWSLGPDRKDNTADDVVSWSGKRNSGGNRSDSADEGFDTTDEDPDAGAEIDLGE
ncbi:MAG: type II secretion system protein GspG [Fuerstiella sp.]|nr:type II secretion system protein GspG [Fuerstiella sp.]